MTKRNELLLRSIVREHKKSLGWYGGKTSIRQGKIKDIDFKVKVPIRHVIRVQIVTGKFPGVRISGSAYGFDPVYLKNHMNKSLVSLLKQHLGQEYEVEIEYSSIFVHGASKDFDKIVKIVNDYARSQISIKQSKMSIKQKTLSPKQKQYSEFFFSMLDKYGVESPNELSVSDKSKFFNQIRKQWNN